MDTKRQVLHSVALIGVLGASGAYILIRTIGTRANALHSISYFSIYSVLVSIIVGSFTQSSAPIVVPNTWKTATLIISVGICGFAAQGLLTLGLQKEGLGRGTVAIYTHVGFSFSFSLYDC